MSSLKLNHTLAILIKERATSITAVARATGIPVTTLFEWTCNRPPRDPVKIKKLSTYFGVSLHFLLFGIEEDLVQNEKDRDQYCLQGKFEMTIKKLP